MEDPSPEVAEPLSVVFDIGGFARDNEHIHSACVRLVQTRLGYCAKDALVADFELRLERDGEWEQFLEVANQIGHIVGGSKDEPFANETFSEILHHFDRDRYTIPMSWIGGQGLLLTKSVRENLTLSVIKRFTDKGFLSRSKEAALVSEMVDFLRIKAGTPEQLAGTLSGGNQQKVIFGKMLLTEARVLLLYDPTRGVDVGTKGEIFQLMRDLAAKGYAILFYSSDLPELVHVADRVLVLRYGRVAATLDGERISEEAILRAAVLDEAA